MAGALKIKGLKTKKTEGVTKPGRRTESESSVTNSNERTAGLAVNEKARPPEGQDQGSEGLISSSVEQEQAVEEERPSKWIHFGPTYGNDTEVNQIAKDSAWQHILETSGGDVTSYLRSIVEIEKEAIDSYDSTAVEQLKRTPQEFVWLMAKDGCFFLQLALHILGAGDSLGYPQGNLYFGEKSDSSSWIPAMFYVGNQIPYVVINALMKQTFFKKVITSRDRDEWLRPVHEEDLAKLALYQTVVEPQLGGGGKASDPPSSILQALHNLLVGPGYSNPISPEMRAFQDLETGIDDSRTKKIPSAGELKKISIKLTKAKRGITNNVQFKNRIFFAHLHVPPLTIDTHTKDLLTSLVKLELLVSEGDREVTAYLRFMRDLAPTYKDFKILLDKGIIQVKDKELLCTMVHMLHNLVSPTKSGFTLKFLNIRRGIEGYKGPPWAVIGAIISALTIIQTVLAAVAYAFPRT